MVDSPFVDPITDQLAPLTAGLHAQPPKPGGVALDFIRGNLMQPQEMIPLPLSVPWTGQ